MLITRLGSRSSLRKVVSELGGSKAFVITGRSLNEKTPVIKELEGLLADSHAGTYAGVRQHAYAAKSWVGYKIVRLTGRE